MFAVGENMREDQTLTAAAAAHAELLLIILAIAILAVVITTVAVVASIRRTVRRRRPVHTHTPEYWRMLAGACEAEWLAAHPEAAERIDR